jgi:peptidoglycan/LPS O-acetylase OafA/YrhL
MVMRTLRLMEDVGTRVDFTAFDAAKYFPPLDGLRAFCVFLVMFNHVHEAVPRWIKGSLGVDVFFVLSGFLISTLLLREKQRTRTVSLKGFYTRRIFRIVPVYFFTVLLYFAAVHATRDSLKISQFNAALAWLVGFLPEYRPPAGGNILGHAWTLGIEEKFYVFWPLLLIALYPFGRRGWLLLGAFFAIVLSFPYLFARSYGGLLIGAALAVVLAVTPRGWTGRLFSSLPDAALCLLLAGTYALVAYRSEFALLFSVAVALLIASLVLRSGLIRRFLEFPLWIYIGKRSYAMYLVHVLVLDSVEKIWPQVLPRNAILVVVSAYVLTLAAAALMYVGIERPCIALGRRLSNRLAERAIRSSTSPAQS